MQSLTERRHIVCTYGHSTLVGVAEFTEALLAHTDIVQVYVILHCMLVP